MMQDVLGFPVEMDEPRDLRFLRRYGSPFWVRPRPDTGTLCLGMDGSQYGRLFLKLAGLPLSGMQFAPEQAAAALAAALRRAGMRPFSAGQKASIWIPGHNSWRNSAGSILTPRSASCTISPCSPGCG